MTPQNRIYITLSPRMRKALELCASLDGSTPASYAALLMTSALADEIEKHPALHERWIDLEREALLSGSWDTLLASSFPNDDTVTPSTQKILKGWHLAGSHPKDYEYGVDEDERYQEKPSGYLHSKVTEAEGFGTIMQMFRAEKYRGKRLRFSAVVKSEDVVGWAGLWMRVDGTKDRSLSFDNMQGRPIQGTIDWRPYEIVLDVPQESSNIAFGMLLDGLGQVWLNDIQIVEVGNEIAVTSTEYLDKPINLDFGS